MKRFFGLSLMAMIAMACSSSSSKSHSPAPSNDTPTDQPPTQDDPSSDPSDPSNTDPNVTADAGDAGPKKPTNQAECIAACESAHPTAAKDSHDLDNSCFFGTCGSVCNDLGQGENKFPSADAGAACDTAAAGSFPIGTPSQACSDCLATTPACCTLWITVFGSTDGQALNKCAQDCWSTFPQ